MTVIKFSKTKANARAKARYWRKKGYSVSSPYKVMHGYAFSVKRK